MTQLVGSILDNGGALYTNANNPRGWNFQITASGLAAVLKFKAAISTTFKFGIYLNNAIGGTPTTLLAYTGDIVATAGNTYTLALNNDIMLYAGQFITIAVKTAVGGNTIAGTSAVTTTQRNSGNDTNFAEALDAVWSHTGVSTTNTPMIWLESTQVSIVGIDRLTDGLVSTVTLSDPVTAITSFNISDAHHTLVINSGISGSNNVWTFTAPAVIDLVSGLKVGAVTINAVTNLNTTINFNSNYVKPTFTSVLITNIDTNNLLVGSDTPLSLNDQFLFDSTKGLINEYGTYDYNHTEFIGVQTAWHYSTIDFKWRSIEIENSLTGPIEMPTVNQFYFASKAGISVSTSTLSNPITITGVGSGIDVPYTLDAGTLEKSINSGASWNTVPNTGNVRLNDQLRINLTSSSVTDTITTALLTVGDVTSDFVISTGAPNNVPISIVGGEYQISTDGGNTWGSWTSLAGTVRLNDLVRVRVLTSGDGETATTATLNVGGVESTYTATTVATVPNDTTPNTATVTPTTQASVNQTYTSNAVQILGMDVGIDVPCSVVGGAYQISTDGGTSWSAASSTPSTIRNGNYFRLIGQSALLDNTSRNVVFTVGTDVTTSYTYTITTALPIRVIDLTTKITKNTVSPIYDTKAPTGRGASEIVLIPGNRTTLLNSDQSVNSSLWLLNVPNFTTATVKLRQNVTKSRGNVEVQINNTVGLPNGNNKMYLCKVNSSNTVIGFKRVNISIT